MGAIALQLPPVDDGHVAPFGVLMNAGVVIPLRAEGKAPRLVSSRLVATHAALRLSRSHSPAHCSPPLLRACRLHVGWQCPRWIRNCGDRRPRAHTQRLQRDDVGGGGGGGDGDGDGAVGRWW